MIDNTGNGLMGSIQENNTTTMTSGVVAGALMAIVWWVLGETLQVQAPAEVVAASVTVVTAIFQFIVGGRSTWL